MRPVCLALVSWRRVLPVYGEHKALAPGLVNEPAANVAAHCSPSQGSRTVTGIVVP